MLLKRKRQDLTDHERCGLLEFLGWPNIIYVTPGKNDDVNIGKVNGQNSIDKTNICCGH